MILVTGASGFVGSALVRRLSIERKSNDIVAAIRRRDVFLPDGVSAVQVGELSPITDWSEALQRVRTVVHCAARVHVMEEKSSNPLAAFRQMNVEGTANLARQAEAAGARRFIFLSSIKVNGEFTAEGRPFTADDVPAPQDPYGISKLEAEQLLRKIAAETGMEVVIIRPPLVYGSGVKANFESLMRCLTRGVPLPLAAATENRRSLVALENLVDLIVTCLEHPAAANQTLLVSDGEDLSTADLLKRLGAVLGHPARLFYLPPPLLRLGATVVRKPGIYQRLYGSLQLDIAKTHQLLNWAPPISVDEGLRSTAAGFHS